MEKTISFLILIGIGVLFKSKIQNKEQLNTIKTLILTVALPAVIFSALLKIDLTASSIYPPLLVLGFNFLIFLSVRYILPAVWKDIPRNDLRTLTLMLPSLAPYLSCFPFISEFSNQSALGMAAIGDTGNKIFILIFLYFLAMYWSCNKQTFGKNKKSSIKIKDILLQPINLTIIIALTASFFGVKLTTLPIYFQDSLAHLRNLLTPTILIFIGLAVKVKGKDLQLILGLLLGRSAITFMFSAILISLLKLDLATALLIVTFPQSSCSFIPYAQMTIFADIDKSKKIFNTSLALSLLAISLPFSSFTIITIYSSGDFFASPVNLLKVSAIAAVTSGILLRKKIGSTRVAATSAR